jgi:ABC-type branched-subunit amino acid transport system substrate-binding protein
MNRIINRNLLAGVALALSAATMLPAHAEDAKTIVLGASNALTGPVASSCKVATDAASAWFAKINAEGGIKGRKIDYQVLDDAYDGARAVTNVRDLDKRGVLALVGGCGTTSAVAIGPLANRLKIPYVLPYATHNDLIKPVKPYIFAGVPLYDKQTAAVVTWALKKFGPGKVAMIAAQAPGTDDWIAAARKATEAAGGTFLEPQISQPALADFTPIVLRLKAQAPDYVIIGIAAGDGAHFIETAKVQKFSPTHVYLGYSTVANGVFLQPIAGELEGRMFATSPTVPEDAPETKLCRDVFAKYNPSIQVNGYALWGCLVGQVITGVLSQIDGPLTRQIIRDKLETLSDAKFTNLLPPLNFSKASHMGINSVFIFGVKNGAYQVVDTAVVPE